MSFNVRHAWHVGSVVNGAQLSTCPQCECLRVTLGGVEYFIRRIVDATEEQARAAGLAPGAPSDDAGARVRRAEPPCVSPAAGFRPPW